MKRKIALFVMVAMIAGGGICLAQAGDARWWTNPDVARKLSLTETEKARLDSLHSASLLKRIDLKSAVAKERLNLDSALNNPKSTDAMLKEQYQKLTRAQNALAAERFNFIIQVRQVLGHERFAVFKSSFEERRRGRYQDRQGRGMRRGGTGQGMGPESADSPSE